MNLITDKPIETERLIKSVESPGAGAIITFNGLVRNNAEGKQVLRMEYEAYTKMAEKLMAELIEKIMSDFNITGITMQHRTGMLEIGESSVMIAVSAPHRVDAFDACQYAIDTIKETIPIWKKEYSQDGVSWVEGTPIQPNVG